MRKKYEIEGMKELEKMIKDLGGLPQKSVTKSAKAGANVALKAVRANAPEETGDLKKGIVLKGERSRTKGKKVYQVTFDYKMNHIFVKNSADGNKRYYYPASMEYGFLTRDGGYIPGYRFMRRSMVDNAKSIEKKMVDTYVKDMTKVMKKG